MASCSLNAKCWNVVGLLVGCGLCSVEEFQNLVPELGCLELVPNFNYYKKFQVFDFF